ncbi:MAG: pilus assembly protein PilO, partial [Methylobacterium sp.]|nr:pilus assembly protein PilO [Methylobacterium sp.]
FKPGQDRPADFYAEMPISIRVVGTYHEIGGFATDISKLSRIVAFGDFSIAPAAKEGKDARLAMDATTKTFRFLDPSEAASKKKADKGGKKKGKAPAKKAEN